MTNEERKPLLCVLSLCSSLEENWTSLSLLSNLSIPTPSLALAIYLLVTLHVTHTTTLHTHCVHHHSRGVFGVNSSCVRERVRCHVTVCVAVFLSLYLCAPRTATCVRRLTHPHNWFS
jgi:hypothetical protein